MDLEDRPPGSVPPVKIVAGNKCDLANSRQVSSQEGLAWARAHNCGFMETSARNVVNIEETFARTLSTPCCLVYGGLVEDSCLHWVFMGGCSSSTKSCSSEGSGGNRFTKRSSIEADRWIDWCESLCG